MRELALVIALSLSSISIFPTQSSAQQMCLSEFPDSAWSNGEPAQVTSKLNYELVGKKSSNYPLLMYSNLAYKGSNFVSTFEYSGVNCSTRKIIISSDSNSIQPIFHSLDDWKNRVKLSAKNFQDEKKNLDTINTSALKLEGFVIEFPVDNKLKTTYKSILEVPKWQEFRIIFGQIGMIPDSNLLMGGRSEYALLLNSLDDCQFSSPADNKFVRAISPFGLSPNQIQFSSMEACRVQVLLASPSTVGGGGDSMRTGLTGFIQFATIIFTPTLQITEIKCKKGKLMKKFTAVNPKCPKGFKKA